MIAGLTLTSREVPAGTWIDRGAAIRVQRGLHPNDWKPMTGIGPGVREIRIRDDTGAFRVIYVASRAEGIYVLHAFQKKTQQTTRRDIDLAATRLRQISGEKQV